MYRIILLLLLLALTLVSCGDEEIENFNTDDIVGCYTWQKSEEDFIHTASVTIFEDGTFSMSFSPISSYFGVGNYTLEDGKLTLNTNDGDYTYTFDCSEDRKTITFDGEHSSAMTWFSEFCDGDVFVSVGNIDGMIIRK